MRLDRKGIEMKVLNLHGVNDFRYEELPTPEPMGDQILIKIGACGICGSDIPRVFELGTRVYPVVLGHEFSGVVCKVGNERDKELIGKRVAVFPLIPCGKCPSCEIGQYCQCTDYDYLGSRSNGGFAEYCLVPSRWHLVISNNEALSLEELAMTEPACVALHAVRKADILGGERVLITGGGPIGLMIAQWARLFGAQEVVVSELVQSKIRLAEQLGFIAINPIQDESKARLLEITKNEGFDVVIEGTGTSSGINYAIENARTGGRMIWLGNPHQDTHIKLENHSLILRKELSMQGVWNSSYSNLPLNEWRYTVHMMDVGDFSVKELISHKRKLSDMINLFEDIYTKKIEVCKAMYSASIEDEKN